jgi:hypothetical protein
METYTKEDIKAMLAFYESPVGKKWQINQQILWRNLKLLDKNGVKVAGMMMKYMPE